MNWPACSPDLSPFREIPCHKSEMTESAHRIKMLTLEENLKRHLETFSYIYIYTHTHTHIQYIYILNMFRFDLLLLLLYFLTILLTIVLFRNI